jgi:hypothetical protein
MINYRMTCLHLGHMKAVETFQSYIHLSYLIAGHKLLEHHPDIPNELAKNSWATMQRFNNKK